MIPLIDIVHFQDETSHTDPKNHLNPLPINYCTQLKQRLEHIAKVGKERVYCALELAY